VTESGGTATAGAAGAPRTHTGSSSFDPGVLPGNINNGSHFANGDDDDDDDDVSVAIPPLIVASDGGGDRLRPVGG